MSHSPERLSEKLSAVLDQMDVTKPSYINIKRVIEREHQEIQKTLNPDKNADIAKELNHHFCDFIQNLLKQYKN